jgi:multicomponent Na+:H+ antiporter subunit E
VLRISLFSSMRTLNPRIITYDIEGLTKLETLLLSHTISLTPGTTTVAIGPGFQYLILHVLEADDPDAVRDAIDRTLRRGILAFTR